MNKIIVLAGIMITVPTLYSMETNQPNSAQPQNAADELQKNLTQFANLGTSFANNWLAAVNNALTPQPAPEPGEAAPAATAQGAAIPQQPQPSVANLVQGVRQAFVGNQTQPSVTGVVAKTATESIMNKMLGTNQPAANAQPQQPNSGTPVTVNFQQPTAPQILASTAAGMAPQSQGCQSCLLSQLKLDQLTRDNQASFSNLQRLEAAKDKTENELGTMKNKNGDLEKELNALKANQYHPTFIDHNKTVIISALLVAVAGAYMLGKNQAAKAEDN